MSDEKVLNIEICNKYVESAYLQSIINRAFSYLEAGYPVHLRGSAGVGKTSLAYQIATKIGRPTILICGSEESDTEELIGGYSGTKKTLLVDNYISSVYKREEEFKSMWMDGRLLAACKNGYTVIYDEFTRVKPEMNNVLLSVLEEKIIDVPHLSIGSGFMKVHPDFRIIFTSNPEEYVGVYSSANALLDRMITIDMDQMDEDTERKIIIAQTGMYPTEAEKIYTLIKEIRSRFQEKKWMSIRASIMLAKLIHSLRVNFISDATLLKNVCKDVFYSAAIIMGMTGEEKATYQGLIDDAVDTVLNKVRTTKE